MRIAFLLSCVVLAVAAGCSDSFNPPELPDLGKVPYDFAVVIPPYPYDMGIQDLSTSD